MSQVIMFAIQVGGTDDDPVFYGKDGTSTKYEYYAKQFSTQGEAEQFATGMRCNWKVRKLEIAV